MEKADYSRGVLERFTRCDKEVDKHVKTVANPRRVNYLFNPHYVNYFEGYYSINEAKGKVFGPFNEPAIAKKISINHYHTKSREEYSLKRQRDRADLLNSDSYTDAQFDRCDRNEEFDDEILHYRDERAKIYKQPDKSHTNERLLNALMKNLSPMLTNAPQNFYAGKMETFLTCRAVAAYLKTKIADDTLAKFFEEVALKAILKSFVGMSFADARLFIRELPNLLNLPYPAVKDIRNAALQIIPQIMNTMRLNTMWRDFVELDYINRLLKLGG